MIVFWDSATDTSLFELLKNSVLILNPSLKESQLDILKGQAKYVSELPCEEGVAQVCSYVIAMRLNNWKVGNDGNNRGYQ